MPKFLSILCFLILLTNCSNEREISFQEYYDLDKVEKVDKVFSPKKTPTIPFPYNKMYDPFILEDSTERKAIFEEGKHDKLTIIVLDSVETSLNVAARKKREKTVKGIPVLIVNTATRKVNSLLLHRGGALLIQEAKDKRGNWVEVERLTQEKMGKFYYQIKPRKYVYTKIPVYKGTIKTTFRVKLFLGKSDFIYSNEYPGMIQSWMLR